MSNLLKRHYVPVEPLQATSIPVADIAPSPVDDDGLDAAPEVTVPTIEETLAERDRLLQEAQAMAAAEVTTARVLVEQIREDARRQGYADGFADGETRARAEAEATLQAAIQAAQDIVARAEQQRLAHLKNVSPVIGDVVRASLRTMLARELVAQPADVVAVVDDLIQYVIESTRVELRVHPSDFAAVTEAHPRWQAMKFGDWDISVVPDAQMPAGGCEIRSEAGRIDARMETKLELLDEAIHQFALRSVSQHGDGV